MIRYAGVNRRGAHVVGQVGDTPATFTEAKYRARWQELTVTDPATGDVLGEIHDLTDNGRRIWWACDLED